MMISLAASGSSAIQGPRYCAVRPGLENKKALELNSRVLRWASARRMFERSVPKACKSNSRKCGERLEKCEDLFGSKGCDCEEAGLNHLSTACSAWKPNVSYKGRPCSVASNLTVSTPSESARSSAAARR